MSMALIQVEEDRFEAVDEDVNEGDTIATQKPKQVTPLSINSPTYDRKPVQSMQEQL